MRISRLRLKLFQPKQFFFDLLFGSIKYQGALASALARLYASKWQENDELTDWLTAEELDDINAMVIPATRR